MNRLILSLVLVSACAPGVGPMVAPAAPVVSESGGVEIDQSGRCFARAAPRTRVDIVEATEVVRPATFGADGTILEPEIVRRVTRPEQVAVAEGARFEAVCPPVLTDGFVASLQRAMLIRGAYAGPITGAYDAATQAAVRAFQSGRDLDSPILARATAQLLGLVATVPG